MKKFFAIFALILSSFPVVWLHFCVINFLPSPASTVSVVVVYLSLLSLFVDERNTLWAALFVGLPLELFSSLPFGVITFSLIVAILVVQWSVHRIFTNRSFYILFISSVLFTGIYRSILFLTEYFLSIWYQTSSSESAWYSFAQLTTVESVVLTSLLVSLLYLVLIRLIPSLTPAFLRSSSYKYVG